MTNIRRSRAFYRIQYAERLRQLRQFTQRFDFRYNLTQIDRADPATRVLLRARVNAAYRELAPFLKRPHKIVRLPRLSIPRSALLKYAGLPRMKNLRAVPIPATAAEKARVSVSRQGDVQVISGDHKEKTFFFPHRVKSNEDYLRMAREMLAYLPPGRYVLRTSRDVLLHRIFDRDLFLEELALFLTAYGDKEGFVGDLIGVKWMGSTNETAVRRVRSLRSVRKSLKEQRKTFQQKAVDLLRREIRSQEKQGLRDANKQIQSDFARGRTTAFKKVVQIAKRPIRKAAKKKSRKPVKKLIRKPIKKKIAKKKIAKKKIAKKKRFSRKHK